MNIMICYINHRFNHTTMTCSIFLHCNPESLWHGILFLFSNFNSEELLTALLSIALVYIFQTKKKKLWIMLQLSCVHSLGNQVHTLQYILCCTSRELLLHSGEPATVVFIYLEMDARLPMWLITRRYYLRQLESLPTSESQQSWQQENLNWLVVWNIHTKSFLWN